MPRSASYLVDLSAIKFEDGESTETWIQAMPLGTYEHPQYGTISIDTEKVQRFVDNVKNGARVQKLDIDYDHKEYSGEAAGWIKDAANRGTDGLWLLVDWTTKAYQLLKDGAYRYFSPEFDDEWTDPKSGNVYKDILFGGGITNRPFLKDIMPINLSEVFANVPPIKSNEGGTAMKPEEVKSFGVKLGLGESATEDQVMEALGKIDFTPKAPPVVEPPPVSDPIAAKALEDAKKLADSNPAIAAVMALYTAQSELVERQGKQLTDFGAKLREEEVGKTVKELCDKANKQGYSIPIPMRDSLKDTLLQLSDPKLSKVILDGFERMVDSQIVALGERGYLRNNRNDEGKTATEEFRDEVKKLTDGNAKLAYADAVEELAKKDPQLYSRVREESYAFSVGGES